MEKYNLTDNILIMIDNDGYIGPLKAHGPIVSPIKVTVKTAKNLIIGGYRVHQYDKESGKVIILTETNLMDKNKFVDGPVQDTPYKPENVSSDAQNNSEPSVPAADESKDNTPKEPESVDTGSVSKPEEANNVETSAETVSPDVQNNSEPSVPAADESKDNTPKDKSNKNKNWKNKK